MDHTKHLSFEFIVPSEFFNASVKVTVAYVIPVRYTLNWKKEVAVEGYTVKPGMAQHIVNWEGLEKEMLAAAVNNSKNYRVPNGRGYFHTPYNPMYNAEANELHREQEIIHK